MIWSTVSFSSLASISQNSQGNSCLSLPFSTGHEPSSPYLHPCLWQQCEVWTPSLTSLISSSSSSWGGEGVTPPRCDQLIEAAPFMTTPTTHSAVSSRNKNARKYCPGV